jgi:hypothetical protein
VEGLNTYFAPNQSNEEARCECETVSSYIETYKVHKSSKYLSIYVQPTSATETPYIPATLQHPQFEKAYQLHAILFDYERTITNNTVVASHYNCLVNIGERWYFCDDMIVREVDFEDFLYSHLQIAHVRSIYYKSAE